MSGFFLIGDSETETENPLCASSLTIDPFLRIKCGQKGRYVTIHRVTPDTRSSLTLTEIAVLKLPLGKLQACVACEGTRTLFYNL